MERSAFSRCQSLTHVTIPQGVETLERGVFYGCAKLTDVTLSETVTEVDKGAFLECYNLVRIHVAPGNENYREIDGCSAGGRSAAGLLPQRVDKSYSSQNGHGNRL